MDILPAIDLRDGSVVRLRRGDYRQQKTYSADPAAVARELTAAGADWIHVVDLDAARTGHPTNTAAISMIRNSTSASVELGGGVRTEATIDTALRELADRVVVGSAALKNWSWFEQLLGRRQDLAGRISLGLDARDGMLAVEGWTEQTEQPAVDIARRAANLSLAAIVYTDIARDGMLSGPNLEATARIVEASSTPVIASGGIRSLDDVAACRRIGCAGVIIGTAYYEGRIDLPQAIALGREGEVPQ